MKKTTILFLIIFLSILCKAQKTDDISKVSNNGINIGFMGALHTVSYSINYEHLFNNRHGLVFGLPLINMKKGKEKGFSLSYRNHWKNKMSSPYWGVFLNYSNIETSAKETVNGTLVNEYRLTNSATTIGVNVGRRWVTNFGLNLAIRTGVGIPFSKFEWIDNPNDQEFEEFSESVFKIISAFDVELSVGYCF